MSIKENKLTCVATNSHRLALRELPLESKVTGSFIIPSKSLNELTKLFNNEAGIIHIFITESYIVFQTNHISLFSRLIEGNYPNVSELLPKDLKTIITVDTNTLLKGIDRACLFVSEWRNNNVLIEILDKSKLRISSNSSELGKIEETQSINSISGEAGLSVSLDGSFLLDALKAIKENEVKLSFGGSMRPVLIEPSDNSSYCLEVWEAFSKTTPPIINTKPPNVVILNGSFHKSTPINAVKAVPIPDQMAYAKLNGIVLRHTDKL